MIPNRPDTPNMPVQGQSAPIDRIKSLLKGLGLTQQDLADKMGLQLQSIKQMLNKSSLRTDTLKRIADALGVPMWQLFASREEVMGENAGQVTASCPHCGKPITIRNIITIE